MTHAIQAHLKGNVLLVGNAVHGNVEKGDIIDGFDSVIRFNKGANLDIITAHQKFIGRKTDIIVTNIVSPENLDERMKGVPILFNQPMSRGTTTFYPKEQDKARRMTRHVMFIPDDVVTFSKSKFNYDSPSTGLKTAMFLHLLGVPFTTTNFSSDPIFTHFFGGTEGVGRHVPDREAIILKSLTSATI